MGLFDALFGGSRKRKKKTKKKTTAAARVGKKARRTRRKGARVTYAQATRRQHEVPADVRASLRRYAEDMGGTKDEIHKRYLRAVQGYLGG